MSANIEVVLILGQLTDDKTADISSQVDRALGRLESVENPELILVINSGGGYFSEAFDRLIEKIRSTSVPTIAKIYHASSAASMIALAAKCREIDKNGAFGFHNGNVEITGSDLLPDGSLTKRSRASLERMIKLNQELLEQASVELPPDMKVQLAASGRLVLNAQQCIDLGVVSRIA